MQTNHIKYIILQNIKFGAVQRHVNLVDLEKCSKTSIWMQKSVPIQPRTDKNEIGCGPTTDSGPCTLAPLESHKENHEKPLL